MKKVLTQVNGMQRSAVLSAEDINMAAYISDRQIKVSANDRITGNELNTLADYIQYLENRITNLEKDFANYIILEKKD